MTRTRSSDSTRDDHHRVGRHHKDDRFKQEKMAEQRGEATAEAREKFQKALKRKEGQLAEQSRQARSEKKEPSLFDLSGKRTADAAKMAKEGEVSRSLKKTTPEEEVPSKGAVKKETVDSEVSKSEVAQLGAKKEVSVHGAEQQVAALHTKGQITSKEMKSKKETVKRSSTEYTESKEVSQKQSRGEARQTAFTLQDHHATRSLGEASKGSVIQKTDLNAIVKQIADNLAILKSGDKIDTQITLRNPPAFEGATITVTEHGTARGEFNLSFANLSNEAKALIDSMGNQDALRQALENKGFAVHIISTSVEADNLVQTEDSQRSGEQDQERQGDQEREEEREQEQ